VDAYCRERRIVAVSPNTLYAHLCVIAMGLRGMQIEENARRLANGLAGLKKQFLNFTEVFEKLGTHLKNVQQSYQEADKRFDKTATALEGMLEPSEPPSPLPSAQESLPLAPVSVSKFGR
jgi:DNA anti-recombination protein RmuC